MPDPRLITLLSATTLMTKGYCSIRALIAFGRKTKGRRVGKGLDVRAERGPCLPLSSKQVCAYNNDSHSQVVESFAWQTKPWSVSSSSPSADFLATSS